MRNEILEVILTCALELDDGGKGRALISLGADSPLYGDQGVLDSFDLVTLVLAVEQEMASQFDVRLTLADERALSRRESPFRTPRAFAEYVEELTLTGRT